MNRSSIAIISAVAPLGATTNEQVDENVLNKFHGTWSCESSEDQNTDNFRYIWVSNKEKPDKFTHWCMEKEAQVKDNICATIQPFNYRGTKQNTGALFLYTQETSTGHEQGDVTFWFESQSLEYSARVDGDTLTLTNLDNSSSDPAHMTCSKVSNCSGIKQSTVCDFISFDGSVNASCQYLASGCSTRTDTGTRRLAGEDLLFV
jgi:hypothetical protein